MMDLAANVEVLPIHFHILAAPLDQSKTTKLQPAPNISPTPVQAGLVDGQ